MNYITFDIETYSPSDLDRIDVNEFRVSVCGCYISWIDKYVAFMEPDIKDFIELMKKADLIIGFNQLWFDLPVLEKYSNFPLKQLPNYDILVEVEKKLGYKIKLDDLCRANFNDDIKTDSYSTYKDYHKQGKWFELIDYCMNDVRLTENLFRQICKTKTISYYDLHQKLEVSLDEPKPQKIEVAAQTQSIF